MQRRSQKGRHTHTHTIATTTHTQTHAHTRNKFIYICFGQTEVKLLLLTTCTRIEQRQRSSWNRKKASREKEVGACRAEFFSLYEPEYFLEYAHLICGFSLRKCSHAEKHPSHTPRNSNKTSFFRGWVRSNTEERLRKKTSRCGRKSESKIFTSAENIKYNDEVSMNMKKNSRSWRKKPTQKKCIVEIKNHKKQSKKISSLLSNVYNAARQY